jgi:hypothetical protein
VGSRSKGPRRDADTLSFVYYRGLKAGPPGESKLSRRIRRVATRETFARGLAKEFAVGAQSRARRARADLVGPALRVERSESGVMLSWPPRRQKRQGRQEPLCRARAPGVSRRTAKLFRRVAGIERLPDGSGPTVRDFTEQWNRLNHRQRGHYRRELVRRGAGA